MTTELKPDKTLEAKLAEPFLDGIKLATTELKTLLAEAKAHADAFRKYDELEKRFQLQADETTSLRKQLEPFVDYPQLKGDVQTLQADLEAFAKIFPEDALAVFGISDRKTLSQPENRKLLPAIFAWLTFVEWSQKEEVQNFVPAFRKVDAAVWDALQGDGRLDNVRSGIAKAVRDVIDRYLRADYAVSWNFAGKGYDESKHHSEVGGTTIVAVKTALITRDSNVQDKARVECK